MATKMFMVDDIKNLKITVSKRKFHCSAMACSVLYAMASTIGYESYADHYLGRIDYWCQYILNLDTDLCQNDLGSIYREAAELFNKHADNLRDESSETEVIR